MTRSTIWRSLLLAFSAIGLAGCNTQSITALPEGIADDPSATIVGEVTEGLVKKNALERKKALSKDITVSAVIGSEGGTVAIPAAGFHLTIPQGAVNSRTKFTVTAIRGTLVAYEFGPHGITFSKGLIARQDLSVTVWKPLSTPTLVAGYFESRSALDHLNGTALVSEVLSGVTSPLTKHFSFKIDHFSGYIVAW